MAQRSVFLILLVAILAYMQTTTAQTISPIKCGGATLSTATIFTLQNYRSTFQIGALPLANKTYGGASYWKHQPMNDGGSIMSWRTMCDGAMYANYREPTAVYRVKKRFGYALLMGPKASMPSNADKVTCAVDPRWSRLRCAVDGVPAFFSRCRCGWILLTRPDEPTACGPCGRPDSLGYGIEFNAVAR